MTTTEYDIIWTCDKLESSIARSDTFSDEIRQRLFLVIEAARKYAKLKEALT